MAEIISPSQQFQNVDLIRTQVRKADVRRTIDAERLTDADFAARLRRSEDLRQNRLLADRELSLDARERARSAQLETDLRGSRLNELDAADPPGDDLPRGSIIDIEA